MKENATLRFTNNDAIDLLVVRLQAECLLLAPHSAFNAIRRSLIRLGVSSANQDDASLLNEALDHGLLTQNEYIDLTKLSQIKIVVDQLSLTDEDRAIERATSTIRSFKTWEIGGHRVKPKGQTARQFILAFVVSVILYRLQTRQRSDVPYQLPEASTYESCDWP